MAGKNRWHTPFFQPHLNNSAKFCNSKDRYRWESEYNSHLKRLQNIESRLVYKPKVIKRNYSQSQSLMVSKERAQALSVRTQLNKLPASFSSTSSRTDSASSSRASSRVTTPSTSRPGSQNTLRRRYGAYSAPVSTARMDTIRESRGQGVACSLHGRHYSELYPDQNYPIMTRQPLRRSRTKRPSQKSRERQLLNQERALFGYPHSTSLSNTNGDGRRSVKVDLHEKAD